jgi:DNA-binding Lrp family transcriptional regulator
MPETSVDELDRLLLAALQLDGRAPWNVVARVVGSTETTVARRAQRLIDAGLLRVVGVVDALRCGLGVPVLARLRCTPGTAMVASEVLTARADTRFVTVVTGSADCVAEFVVPARRSLPELLGNDPALNGLVTDMSTYMVMRGFRAAHDWDPGMLGSDAVRVLRPHPVPPFEGGPLFASPEPLDELDLAIISELVEDGRRTYKQIAAALSTSETTVARRLEGLVQRGCIRFRTLVDPILLGFNLEAMVWLTIHPAELTRAGEALAEHSAVKYLVATAGPHQMAGRIALRHHDDLYDFVTEILGRVPGLIEFDLTVEVATLKRSWVPSPAHIRTGRGVSAHDMAPALSAITPSRSSDV